MTVRKKSARKTHRPLRSKDIPASAEMLSETRFELKSEIGAVRLEARAESKRNKARHEEITGKLEQVDSRFKQGDGKFEAAILDMKSRDERIFAEIHSIKLLVEEQNARNKYVLDGYAQITSRLDRLEGKSEPEL